MEAGIQRMTAMSGLDVTALNPTGGTTNVLDISGGLQRKQISFVLYAVSVIVA